MIRTVKLILSSQRKAALLISHSRKVIFSNMLARQLIKQSKSIKLQNSRLLHSSLECEAELKKALNLSSENSTTQTIYWFDPASMFPIRVDVLPVLDHFNHLESEQSYFMILFSTSTQDNINLNVQFKDKYSLTPTELELVKVMLKGLTLRQIAEEKSRAISTIQWTLGNVYEKTDTRSQKQLLSLASLFLE